MATPLLVPGPAIPTQPVVLQQKDQILIMSAPQDVVISFWESLLAGADARHTSNASLPPSIRQLTQQDLAFKDQTLPFGHCSVLLRRTRKGGVVLETPAIREGGNNNDSPRITGLRGLCVHGKASSVQTKIYAYHLAAAYHAYNSPRVGLTEHLLRSVAREKSRRVADTHTIMHLCGNKWCVEGLHLVVGRKQYNDQQTACHRGLQSSLNSQEVAQVQEAYCRPTIKCWTVLYKGVYSEAWKHEWE